MCSAIPQDDPSVEWHCLVQHLHSRRAGIEGLMRSLSILLVEKDSEPLLSAG